MRLTFCDDRGITGNMEDKYINYLKDDHIEKQRYLTLKKSISGFSEHISGKKILDFGASYALTTCALLECGAERIYGVEPDKERVARGNSILEELGLESVASIQHVKDTANLPFDDGSFDAVIANAVLEHIPQPRTSYIREMWRVLKVGGSLIVNETPNKYFPVDTHTTGLWFVPWLPLSIARRYALFRKHFQEGGDWATSGWRGIGYYELAGALEPPYERIQEKSRARHRLLSMVGLPAALIDPYPIFIFRKK